MFTSFLRAAARTVPLTSVTSYWVHSFETGTTRMQSTWTLMDFDVPTETLPCSRVRESPLNFTTDSGWIRTVEPSASRLAADPGLVSSKSPARTAVESRASLPLIHTPLVLCRIADPVSAAVSDGGSTRHSTQQMRQRRVGTLIPEPIFTMVQKKS